jgi:hypothetical protein
MNGSPDSRREEFRKSLQGIFEQYFERTSVEEALRQIPTMLMARDLGSIIPRTTTSTSPETRIRDYKVQQILTKLIDKVASRDRHYLLAETQARLRDILDRSMRKAIARSEAKGHTSIDFEREQIMKQLEAKLDDYKKRLKRTHLKPGRRVKHFKAKLDDYKKRLKRTHLKPGRRVKHSTGSEVTSDSWPQYLITRIVGTEDLPDVEILTLAYYPSSSAISELAQLQTLLLSPEFEEFKIRSSAISYDPGACLAALDQVILDAYVREKMPECNPSRVSEYAEKIYSLYPVPVMNSPISGSTLLQMLTAAGSSAGFMAAFPHATLGEITIYLLTVGTTRIALGAANGIATGLQQGLSHLLLRWMGVPKTAANPKKKTSKTP